MKKGTIYKNLWAGYETYFVAQKIGGRTPTVYGWKIMRVDDKWKLSEGRFYLYDLNNDREHFPIVGSADIEQAIMQAILSGIGEGK